MRKLAIEEINESVRLILDGVPVCEMLGTHRQKIERAQFFKCAGQYKIDNRIRRDQEREIERFSRVCCGVIPKHFYLGEGVHFLAFGDPECGSAVIQTSDPEDKTINFAVLPKLTREEVLAWIPHINQPPTLREAYQKMIESAPLSGEEEA